VVIYAFWFDVDSEQHARAICFENGLKASIIRRPPQLVRPGHKQKEMLQCRATKECESEEALELNKKLGQDRMPEALAV
jgi:hypothetical protein